MVLSLGISTLRRPERGIVPVMALSFWRESSKLGLSAAVMYPLARSTIYVTRMTAERLMVVRSLLCVM